MNKIKRIEIEDPDHITFWFFDSDEPWDISEFKPESPTRKRLEKIIELVLKG